MKPRKPKGGPFHTDTSLGATRLAWRPEDDGGQVARDMAERQRRNIAPFASSELAADSGNYEVKGGPTKSVIERRLSKQPAAIRDIARALSREFKSQASELKQLRWNDKDRIAQRDNLLALSENLAIDLANLADNLDQAISKGSKRKPEPVFLGKAAQVVQRLHFRLMGWLEENRTAVFDVSYRVGVLLTGIVFRYWNRTDCDCRLQLVLLWIRLDARRHRRENGLATCRCRTRRRVYPGVRREVRGTG
jgi:hypothetical protein